MTSLLVKIHGFSEISLREKNRWIAYMSRSATKSCVLCFVSCVFLFTIFFSVFAEGVFVNAKMNFQVKKQGKYFGIYENYFSKNTKNKEIKRHKTQDIRHKTQLVDERDSS